MSIVQKPRVALLAVRFTLFDAEMGSDFAARMQAHRARSIALLEPYFEVTSPPMVENDADGDAAAAWLAEARPNAIVLAPTMAAPPSYAARALQFCDAPLVIWNAPSILRLPEDLSQAEATVHSSSIGSLMYANLRSRQGRPAAVVTAAHDDPSEVERLIRTVRAVAAAGALRNATFLRVGDPMAGYLDIEATSDQLSQLRVHESAVPLDTWEFAVNEVSAKEAADLFEQLRGAGWTGEPGPQAEASARIAIALGRALDAAGAVGGTVNCHGPWFRRSAAVGLPACLGVACQTGAGRPISCTGDQPTAIVLQLARQMAGAALYCECYAPEIATGLVLLAAGGEGDPAWAPTAGGVTLEANDHYPGERGQGTSVSFALQLGPATLLSLSPSAEGWVLVWGTGEVVESRYADMRGPNGMFRFDRGTPGRALDLWIGSGATHHNALAPGRLEIEIPALTNALGIRSVQI